VSSLGRRFAGAVAGTDGSVRWTRTVRLSVYALDVQVFGFGVRPALRLAIVQLCLAAAAA
jgi:hypothetical protein